MTKADQTEIKKLEDFLKISLTRLIDMWQAGEGDLIIEVRDDKGVKKAKIKGGSTERIE